MLGSVILCLGVGFAVMMKKKGEGGDRTPSRSDTRAVDNPTYEGAGEGEDGTKKGRTDGFGFGAAANGEGYLEVAAK